MFNHLFIRGMARTEAGFIILLDVGRVLSVDDMAGLASAAHMAA
jgi:purine-binding chemotaxis protein CheW